MIQYTGKWTVRALSTDQVTVLDTLAEGLSAATEIVGNRSFANPFEGTYLFGPGDGTTTVMVRRQFNIVREAAS